MLPILACKFIQKFMSFWLSYFGNKVTFEVLKTQEMWTKVQNTILMHCIIYAKSLQCDNTTLEKLSQNSILKVSTKAHTQHITLNTTTIKEDVKHSDIPPRHLYVNLHVKHMALCQNQHMVVDANWNQGNSNFVNNYYWKGRQCYFTYQLQISFKIQAENIFLVPRN